MNNAAAGHVIEVVAYGVTNGSGTGGALSVSTSKDTTPVPVALNLVPKQPLADAQIIASDTTPGGTGVTYTVDIETSSSGGLTGGNNLNFGFGASVITILAPTGIAFPSDPTAYSMTDVTQGGPVAGLCTSCTNPPAIVRIGTKVGIAVPATLVASNVTDGGDEIRIVINGVTNPQDLVGTQLSTTSDSAIQTPIVTSTTEELSPCGDVNVDGKILAGDALAVLRAAVGTLACDL